MGCCDIAHRLRHRQGRTDATRLRDDARSLERLRILRQWLASTHAAGCAPAITPALQETDNPLPAYTRTAQNEIYSQFKRLPNPDLVLYVFPHLTGTDPAPVPGYSTVFPLYQRVQYAMPGERIEDY